MFGESSGGPSGGSGEPCDTGDEKDLLYRQDKHEQQGTKSADSAPKKIRAIDHVNPGTEVHEGQPYYRCPKEKRNKQQYVIRDEKACLFPAEENELGI
jgi:hypothetical protein